VAILLTKAGRVELARAFFADIQNAHSYFHFAIGKTTAWPDEETPEDPLESLRYINDFRNNIILTQSITSAEICHLIPRIDWEPEIVFDSYDDNYSPSNLSASGASKLSDSKFYVITDESKVYKCIDNNSNARSTVKPTSTSTNVVILADGYTWKFMFQVSASDQTKFLDSSHIPVRKLTTTPYGDVNGEIDFINVTAGGAGYDSLNPPTVTILGDGDGLATATATVVAGAVTAITPVNRGSGYTFAFVSLSGEGGGAGAKADVLLGDTDPNPGLQSAVENSAIPGSLDRVLVLSGGQDYTSGDVTVTITGDGKGAEATAIIAAGSGTITGVNITSGGTGYTFADITFTQNVGIGTGASARSIISPLDGHGSNPVKELFSTTVGITLSFEDNTNEDLFLNNDFRQIGLIKNIGKYNAPATLYTQKTGSSLFVVDVDSAASYAIDDIILTDDQGKFRVIQIRYDDTTSTYKVHLQPIIPLISSSSTLINDTQNIPELSINSVVVPEIKTSSGIVLYIENRPSITRSTDQVETIKALVNF
jgi:hypothetical protein